MWSVTKSLLVGHDAFSSFVMLLAILKLRLDASHFLTFLSPLTPRQPDATSIIFLSFSFFLRRNTPPRVRGSYDSLCDLLPSHLIFYSFQMTAKNVRRHRLFTLSLLRRTSKKAYILSSLLNHKIVFLSRARKPGEHNSIKYLFDSNVFIDEERLALLVFHIPRSHLTPLSLRELPIACCKHTSSVQPSSGFFLLSFFSSA